MIKNYVLEKVYLGVFGLLFIVGCNQERELKSIKKEDVVHFERTRAKTPKSNKKGIEIMAEYKASLMKRIDEEKSSYTKDYLIKEYEKAVLQKKNKPVNHQKNATVTAWTERGPANVPGRTRNVVVAPDDPDTWYAGSVGGGLWKTEDAGVTWTNLTDFKVPNLSTSTVVVSPSAPQTLYVGTGEPFNNLDAIGGIGVLKSTDGGNTWTHLEITSNFGAIGRMTINPDNANNVVVGSRTGVYVTTNGGNTWTRTYSGGNVQDLNAEPGNFNVMYAGVNGIGVIKSTNAGSTWTLVFDKNNFNSNHGRFELDISPVNPSRVIVGVYSPQGTETANTDFYITDNSGSSFEILEYNLGGNGNLLTGQGWYDNIVTAHPFDEDVFYAGGVVMYRVSINDGASAKTFSFTPIAGGYNNEVNDYVHVDQHGLTYNLGSGNQFRLILSNDGGVYSTNYITDPGTAEGDWTDAAVGYNSTQFYGADKANGSDFYIAGAQDNGSHITNVPANATTQYQGILGGDGFESLWNYKDPNKFMATSQYNFIARYVNGAGVLANHGDTGSGTSPFYSKIANANGNPDVVFSPSRNGVWRSVDFGESWELTPIVGAYAQGASSALNVSVSIANPDIVWAGSGMTQSGSLVPYVSQDNGRSYEPTSPFIDPRGGSFQHTYLLSDIETSPTNENRAYALFSGQGAAKVLKTDDLGQSWTDISGYATGERRGFPDVAVHSIVEMPFDENVIWVGTDLGIFETENGGQSWSLIEEFPAVSVWQMKIVNDQVVLATHGRGIWTATIAELAGYEPPAYFAAPDIVQAYQESFGNQNIVVSYTTLSSDVDKVNFFVDGNLVSEETKDFNAGENYTYTINGVAEGGHLVEVQAISDGGATSIKNGLQVDVIDFNQVAGDIVVPTFTADDVYTYGGEFVIDDVGGDVSGPVLNNSDHPYATNIEYTTVLKNTITVDATSAEFNYEDVTITEPESDPNAFFDHVLVEATTNLRVWDTLAIYDSRKFNDWLNEYDTNGANASINDELFKEQTINLLDTYPLGEEIAIRFRLVSDPFEVSFGWAIRSINKDRTLSVTSEELQKSIAIYPTVGRNDFKIKSSTFMRGAQVDVYDLKGSLVESKKMELGNTPQNLLSSNLESGLYLIKVTNEGASQVTKIIVR